jgi:hypothetical protein
LLHIAAGYILPFPSLQILDMGSVYNLDTHTL